MRSVDICRVSLGTFELSDPLLICKAIVEGGVRSIDTAAVYGSEIHVGQGIKMAAERGVKREELFITTKLWFDCADKVEETLKKSLEMLDLDYVDLYLIHWPIHVFLDNAVPTSQLWSDMEGVHGKGLARKIGVSNFNIQLLADLLSYCKVKPYCNQILVNPLCTNKQLIQYCIKRGVIPIAYTPMGRAPNGTTVANHLPLMQLPKLKELARDNGMPVPEMLIRWILSLGCSVVVKSGSFSHICANIALMRDLKSTKGADFSTITTDQQLKMNEVIERHNINWFIWQGGDLSEKVHSNVHPDRIYTGHDAAEYLCPKL